MNDIMPAVPAGRQLIQGYGAGNFRIAGEAHSGSVIILPEITMSWSVTRYEDIAAETLSAVAEARDSIEVLLIGCGPRMGMPRADIRDYLKGVGIVPEWMDTGAACRTFNVLLTEDRAVAAALIAVE
jgi:uncharacterized protein